MAQGFSNPIPRLLASTLNAPVSLEPSARNVSVTPRLHSIISYHEQRHPRFGEEARVSLKHGETAYLEVSYLRTLGIDFVDRVGYELMLTKIGDDLYDFHKDGEIEI